MSYQDSQQYIFDAESATRAGDKNLAKQLFMRAAILQKELLAELPSDRVKTRAVFGLSVASLFYKSGDIDASERAAHETLAQSCVDPYPASKLRELLMVIWNDRTVRNLSPTVDVLDVRIIPTNHSSTIRLSSAADVYNAIYRLFAFAASVEERMSMAISKEAARCFDRVQWIGKEFAATLVLTPSEARSFSFRVESSLADSSFSGSLGTVEFRRAVMVRVVRGLHRCRSAADREMRENPINEYMIGMNANMSKAVVDLYGQAGGPIEFSAAWSPTSDYQMDDDIRTVGVIRYDEDVVQMAHRMYVAQNREPPKGEIKSIEGTVVSLKGATDKSVQTSMLDSVETPDYNDQGQDIEFDDEHEVVVEISNARIRRGKRIHFSLNDSDYRRACDAHRDGKNVCATGWLNFTRGKWVLDPCRDFRVLG